MNKLFIACFLGMAGLGAFLITQDVNLSSVGPKKKQDSEFSHLWKEDLKKMEGEIELPPEWGDIKFVRVIALDQNLHSILKDLHPAVMTRKDGRHRLEVSLMSHESEFNEGQIGIIFQYNLIEIDSDEMTWETSRTLFVKPRN